MLELPPSEYRALVKAIEQAIAQTAAPPAALAPLRQATASAGLAAAIEHTLLAPGATAAQIAQLCAEAEAWGCAAVCVNPAWVAQAAVRLRPTPVRVVATLAFPMGATLATVKRAEAAECLKLGADDLDMVINLGALQSGADTQVREDIRGVVELAHAAGAQVKAILETGLLTQAQKVRACELALEAGADFVKTSTGFGPSGATVADVELLRATVGDRARVKASGGIRTLAQAQALLAAGATRLGTSHTAAILAELPR